MNPPVLDFEQAKARHLLFKSRLRSLLYDIEVDEGPVLSHHECGLGQWIYDHALPAYGHLPAMRELERVHAEIHAVARRLVEQYRDGHPDEAREGLTDMERVAEHLTALLDDLEKQLRTAQPATQPAGEVLISLSLRDFQELLRINRELDHRIRDQVAETARTTEHLALSNQALDEQRGLMQTIFDNADVALFLMDERQQCVFMNPAAERLTGFTLAEVQGNNLHSFIHHTHPDGRPYPIEECPIDRALPERSRMRGEDTFVRPDGTFYPVAFTASPILNPEGQPVGTVIEVRDQTEARRARQALEESETLLRTITDASPVGLFLTNEEGRVIYANQTILDWLGMDRATYLANGGAEAIVAEDLPGAMARFTEAFTKREAWQDEFRIHHADGTIHSCLISGAPRYRADGTFAGYAGSFTDITERKAAEEQLRRYYDELEVKVTFRNLELEREVRELRALLGGQI